MTRYVGNSEVLDRFVGNQPVLRRYGGNSLVHEWEASLLTALPSWISYARAGAAWRWVSGTGHPKLQSVTADTPRFDLDWRDGSAIGLLFEGAAENLCGYGRGSNQGTGGDIWTASNVSVSNVVGAEQTGTKARRLTASAANGTYSYASGLVTANAAGVWVFGALVRRQAGYGDVWIRMTHSGGTIERNISADLQVFAADETTPRFVPVFVSGYAAANSLVSVGFKIAEQNDAIDVDFPQLELSANGRGYPTSPIDTENAASAPRSADSLTLTRAHSQNPLVEEIVTITGEQISYSDSEVTDRALGDWRDREERHVKSLRCIRTAQGSHDWRLTLSTPAENRANSGWHPGAPSAITYEDIYPDLAGHYSNQLIPAGYTLTRTFAAAGASYRLLESGDQRLLESGDIRLLEA